MPELNHDSPASIRAFLESRDLAPRKRWGQNFLINRGAREKIVGLLDAGPGLSAWEIGPGLGAMSALILDSGARLTVFEIDPAYREWLAESLGASADMEIVPGDVMKTWEDRWDRSPPDRILGNLPYNAASAIIAAFIESGKTAPVMVFTVQDEMGRRMMAEPGGKDYSSFTVLCRTAARVIDGGRLTPGSFYPPPRVHSRIIVLRPEATFGAIADPPLFRALVRRMFASRRKTIGNNLKAAASLGRPLPGAEALAAAFAAEGIDLGRRPETVGPGQWVSLANRLPE